MQRQIPNIAESNPVRVGLVDDHELFRGGLRELLDEQGFETVGEAPDGERGIQLVEETAPDVVVMDLNMPGISGLEATRRIRLLSPTTRVLVLTVSAESEDVNEAILAGASGYLLKDAAVETIAEGVAAAARGEALLSPEIAVKLLNRMRGDESSVGVPAEARPVLTNREHEVLRLVAEGKDNSEIAADLFISPQTVKNHVSNVLGKLEVDNRLQAAIQAVRRGIV